MKREILHFISGTLNIVFAHSAVDEGFHTRMRVMTGENRGIFLLLYLLLVFFLTFKQFLLCIFLLNKHFIVLSGEVI